MPSQLIQQFLEGRGTCGLSDTVPGEVTANHLLRRQGQASSALKRLKPRPEDTETESNLNLSLLEVMLINQTPSIPN